MSANDADAGPRDVPHTGMPDRSLVKEDGGRQLLWIDGVLPLPEGTRIELAEPRADGVVTRVRLAAARPGMTPTLVLDVKLDEAGGAGDHESTSDPWVSTVINVSGFLAGFSFASVVVISDGPDHFRWPGVSLLALTIASVVLLAAAQEARRAARYYKKYRAEWRRRIWAAYHAGIVMLLVGLGAALAPRPGPGAQLGFRWVAMGVAFAAALVELALSVRVAFKRQSDSSEGKDAPFEPA